jgi:hypothetical protein
VDNSIQMHKHAGMRNKAFSYQKNNSSNNKTSLLHARPKTISADKTWTSWLIV